MTAQIQDSGSVGEADGSAESNRSASNNATLIERAWQQRERSWVESQSAVKRLWAHPLLSALDKARLQIVKSYHFGRQLELRAAVSSGVDALPVISGSADQLWMCRALGRVAAALHSLGDFDAALRHYQTQIRLASERLAAANLSEVDQDRFTEELFCGRHNLAHQFFRLNEFQQAHRHYEHCYSLVQGNEVSLGYLLVNHSQCYMARGNYRKAKTQAEAALEIGRRCGIPRIVVYALPVLARLADLARDAETARRYLLEGIDSAQASGLYRSHIQLKLAQHYFDTDCVASADEVLASVDQVTDAVDESHWYLLQCNLAERKGDYALALAHHKQHLAVKERMFQTRNDNQAYAAEVVGQLRELEESNRRLSVRNRELTQSVEQIGRDQSRLRLLAQRDPLTDLFNRRHFMDIAQTSLRQAQTADAAVSLAIIDIHFFKRINDSYGHDTGDQVLKTFADLLKNHFRQSDTLARFGGEEFVALLPGTSEQAAVGVMRSLLLRCEHYPWSELAQGLAVTCSVGVAQTAADSDFTGLFKRADLALYRAKHSGRNRVECSAPVATTVDDGHARPSRRMAEPG